MRSEFMPLHIGKFFYIYSEGRTLERNLPVKK